MLRSNLNNWNDYRFCHCMSEREPKPLSIKIMHIPEVLIGIRKCLDWCDIRSKKINIMNLLKKSKQ